MQFERACNNRVLRLLLERAIHLSTLIMFTDVDDIDAAFVDVRINAPLQNLQLRKISDVTIKAIGQLGKSLTKLVVENCDKITNDGKNFYVLFKLYYIVL